MLAAPRKQQLGCALTITESASSAECADREKCKTGWFRDIMGANIRRNDLAYPNFVTTNGIEIGRHEWVGRNFRDRAREVTGKRPGFPAVWPYIR